MQSKRSKRLYIEIPRIKLRRRRRSSTNAGRRSRTVERHDRTRTGRRLRTGRWRPMTTVRWQSREASVRGIAAQTGPRRAEKYPRGRCGVCGAGYRATALPSVPGTLSLSCDRSLHPAALLPYELAGARHPVIESLADPVHPERPAARRQARLRDPRQRAERPGGGKALICLL